DSAVATVSYMADAVQYHREVFASYPDQVIVTHLTTRGTRALDFYASLSSIHPDSAVSADGRDLVLAGSVADSAIRFEARLAVETDGAVETIDGSLHITGASSATLLLAGATNFVSFRDVSG